ncbi:MAG: type III-B CRISPR-associated protein Cas10/Cmr2 [Chloroflexi bacterium]|nr:type III-B CRISPR-associated protein Cas10/Cmr2 [Chloroflexota bacterium]
MKHLFLCMLGPVQDFIATARRSRDLWYGSWMLSELSKAAAKAIADRYELGSLVFPAPRAIASLEPGSDLNVPNKIVAIVEGDPDEIGANVENAVRKRLESLRENALGKVRGQFDRGLAIRQMDDLVEYYWVGVPVEDGRYGHARDLAEWLMAARKGTRDFQQFGGKPVPKSSLDGIRESVIPEDAYPAAGDPPDVRVEKQRDLYLKYGARRGERLSGVDLIKRNGQRGDREEPDFRSTSHMAAIPFLEMVDRVRGAGEGDSLLKEVYEALRESGMEPHGEDGDGALLFESRLREWAPDDETLKQARSQWNGLIQRYAGDARPQPYYALLRADGDNMGKTIDSLEEEREHRKLSQELSEFAAEVKKLVKRHRGVLIYSGGDDILAYLPLHTVLACARELAQGFDSRMSKFSYEAGKHPTLSVGIVVAHHLYPLSEVLEMSRDAERAAKFLPGKNGLAIILSKRSGVDRTIAGRSEDLHRRLQEMIALVRKEAISKKAAYELRELDRVLGRDGTLQGALKAEAMRIVGRRREPGGAVQISQEVKDKFSRWLDGVVDTPRPVAEVSQELIVAITFAEALDMAEGRLQIGRR